MSNGYIFPPIVDTYQEAAVIGRTRTKINEDDSIVNISEFMKISFTDPNNISNNDSNSNKSYSIEVSVRDQNTNKSILTSGNVLEINSLTNPLVIGESNFYSLKDIVDQWYKVQLRYAIKTEIGTKIETEYSEWSTVTLVKVIGQPTLDIELYNADVENEGQDDEKLILNSSYVKLNGKLSFDNNSKEELKSYQISLLSGDKIFERTKILYPTQKNEIEPITLKTSLKKFSQTNYTIKVDYETKGFYKGAKDIIFSYNPGTKTLQGQTFFSADPLNEKGYIQLQVGLESIPTDTAGNETSLSIYRASYLDHYSQREKIIEIDFSKFNENKPQIPLISYLTMSNNESVMDKESGDASNLPYNYSQVFADTTAEPGILYHYFLSGNNGEEYEWGIGDSTFSYVEAMLDTEHIFLSDNNAMFRVNLNPNISNFKYVVQESITNTLGGQYPFVRRSGDTKYRQFSLSGTICGYGDQEGIFLSQQNAFQLAGKSYFRRYKADNRIMPWNDYIFEKEYRDKAISFLMDGKPKIFKSFTEGSMLVMLTAISFTPNKQLDRNIYDFTATVTEIDEFTVENCLKHGCYEDNAATLYDPPELYLQVVKVEDKDNYLTGYQEKDEYRDFLQDKYLAVIEISNSLNAYSYTDELAEIMRQDSLNREENKT